MNMELSREKNVKISKNYVSCVKINGVPVLPPLMTQECRQEMLYYKELAVAVEQRIRDLQSFLACQSSCDSTDNDSEKDQSNSYDSLKHDSKLIVYNDDLLNVSKNEPSLEYNTNEEATISEKEVGCQASDYLYSHEMNLRSDPEEFPLNTLQRISDETIVLEKTLTSMVNTSVNEHKNRNENDQAIMSFDQEFEILESTHSSPPKLIRQNSYVLDSPGPMLQAHLKVQSLCSGVDLHLISMSESALDKQCDTLDRRSCDMEIEKEPLSSIENFNLKLNTNSLQAAKTNTESDTRIYGIGSPSKLLQSSARCEEQQIAVCTKRSLKLGKSSNSIDKIQIEDSVIDGNKESADRIPLQKLLHDMQKDYMIRMSELIARQKQEQYFIQKNFEQQRLSLIKKLPGVSKNLLFSFDSNGSDISIQNNGSSLIEQSVSPLSNRNVERKIVNSNGKQSCHVDSCVNVIIENSDDQIRTYRSNNTLDDVNNLTLNSDENQSCIGSPRAIQLQKIAIETTEMTNSESAVKNERNAQHSGFGKKFRHESFDLCEFVEPEVIHNATEIFSPKKNDNILGKEIVIKREKAATTIVAYARGYLVRRLLRTDRVQNIVHTISDALVCALELHRDSTGIHGADVDLHRRLIQQITAACYTLHETFFTISIHERMEIIAHDRERLQILSMRQSMQLPPTSITRKPSPIMSRSLPAPRKSDSPYETKPRSRLSRFSTSTRAVSDSCKIMDPILPHGKKMKCAPITSSTITN